MVNKFKMVNKLKLVNKFKRNNRMQSNDNIRKENHDMSNAEKLLEEMQKRPDAENLMKECCNKKTLPEYAEALLSVAQEMGIETQVDVAELVDYLEKMEASKKAATDRVAGEITAIDDDDIEAVAGGKTICGSRQMNEDHVLDCFIDDLCAWVYN
jgi:hypothetical protein